MEQTNTEILAKITKLLESAELNANNGHVAEANNAAFLAAKLMTKYSIEQATVDSYKESRGNDEFSTIRVNPDDYGIKTGNKSYLWRRYLASSVAYTFLCANFYKPATSVVGFVGKPANVEVAKFVYVYLLRKVEEAAEEHREELKALSVPCGSTSLGTFKFNTYRKLYGGEITTRLNDFRKGMVAGLVVKMQEARDKSVKEAANPENALIVLKNEVEEANRTMSSFVTKSSSNGKLKVSSGDSAASGFLKGQETDIPTTVGTGTRNIASLPGGN
jgi:hypothetical protein